MRKDSGKPVQGELKRLLYAELGDYALARDLQVDFPNRDFSSRKPTTKKAKYLRANLMPSKPEVMGITNGWAMHNWIFQVSIFVRDNTGEFEADDIVEELEQVFPFNKDFIGAKTVYTVVEPPYAATSYSR